MAGTEKESHFCSFLERLVESGKLIGIQVLDHVVIGRDRYFSFADKGLL